jgi:hypothetical protein
MQFSGSASLPSGVYLDPLADNDPWLVGRPAERAALVEPGNFEPTPKRSIPLGTVYLAEREVPVTSLISATLQAVFREAWRQQDNTPPVLVLLTHPADWPPSNLQSLLKAARSALPAQGQGIRMMTVAEPVAAAWHAANSRNVPPRARIAVLDLGGGTCDVAVVDRDGRSFRLASQPLGVDPLGGEDFDVRLLEAVLEDIDQPDLHGRLLNGSRAELAAYLDLRRSCREAKEQLSNQVRAHVRVPAVRDVIPDGASVQVSRPHRLEPLLLSDGPQRPGLDTAADLTMTALQDAPRTQAPAFVFLVGGSSRIPMLGQLVQSRTGLHPLEHGDPGTAVAEGGASIASDALAGLPVPAVEASGGPTATGPAQVFEGAGPTHDARYNPDPGPARRPMPPPVAGPVPAARPLTPPTGPAAPPPAPVRSGKMHPGVLAGIAAAAVLVLVAGVFGVLKLRGGDAPPPTTPTPVAEQVDCWDGAKADAVAACPMLEGEEALRYVFATNDPQALDCHTYDGEGKGKGEVATLACKVDGHPKASIYLSQWASPKVAQTYFKSQYGDDGVSSGVSSEEDIALRWTTDTPTDDLVRTAWSYTDYPYSVEVFSTTPEDRDAADKLITALATSTLKEAGPIPGQTSSTTAS